MITVLAHRSALIGLTWFASTRECTVRFGRFCGHLIGREPWVDPWEWLHVPSLRIAKEILEGCPVSASLYGVTKATEIIGDSWPLVERDEKTKVTAGVPHIAGGAVALELEDTDGSPVDGWTVTDGKISDVKSTEVNLGEIER